MLTFIRILGIVSPILGIATTVAAFLPGYGSLVALVLMLPSFLISSAYILLSNRVGIEHVYANPGYIGLILSSTPLLFVIYFNFIR
jgi:hypothetical protein